MSTLNLVYLVLACIVSAAGAVGAALRVVNMMRARWIAQADNTRAMIDLTTQVRALAGRITALERRIDH